jgi:hypothetical protein
MTQLLKPLIEKITKDPIVHAKWLNTLSYMENTGAKKISKFESKTDVSLLISVSYTHSDAADDYMPV